MTHLDQLQVNCFGGCAYWGEIKIDNAAVGRGTSKYIYVNSITFSDADDDSDGRNIVLDVKKFETGFPYMLYEENSCIYGGIYIIETIAFRRKYQYGDEILSLCDPKIHFVFNIPTWKFSVLIIHYEHYSEERLNFEVEIYVRRENQFVLPQNLINVQDETANINITSNMFHEHRMLYIESYLLNLRQVQYVYINVDVESFKRQWVELSVYRQDKH